MDTHITPKLSDYILDLLSAQEKKQIEQHAAACPVCQTALMTERQIQTAVRETLQALPVPSTAQLQHLMPSPPPPAKHLRRWREQIRMIGVLSPEVNGWLRPLAAVVVMALLFIITLNVPLGPEEVWSTNPAATSLAATATFQPTSTSTSTATSTTLPNEPTAAVPTPIPDATPIAQIPLTGSPHPEVVGSD